MKIEFVEEGIVGHGYKTLADLPIGGYGATVSSNSTAIYVRSFNSFTWFDKSNGNFGELVTQPQDVKIYRVFKVEGIGLKLQEVK